MHIRDGQTADLPALIDSTIEAFRPLFEAALPAALDPHFPGAARGCGYGLTPQTVR